MGEGGEDSPSPTPTRGRREKGTGEKRGRKEV